MEKIIEEEITDLQEEQVVEVGSFVPAPDGCLYANVDENHKLIIINQVDAYNQGLPCVEFEIAWNGSLYEKGYAPEKPQEIIREDIKQMRIAYRHTHIDDQTLERNRKMANGSWTEEDEAAYLALDAEVTAYIEENFPYPTDPIIEEQPKEE